MTTDGSEKGVKKLCPSCGEVLFSGAEISGYGSIRVKCIHCGGLFQIKIYQKTKYMIVKIAAVVLLFSLAASRYGDLVASNMTCKELYQRYKGDWHKIQELYKEYPDRYKNLNRDHDAYACDTLMPESTISVPK